VNVKIVPLNRLQLFFSPLPPHHTWSSGNFQLLLNNQDGQVNPIDPVSVPDFYLKVPE